MFRTPPIRYFQVATLSALVFSCLLLGACAKCDPVGPAASAAPAGTASSGGHATLTVEASVSSGTRFILYTNDNWKEPHVQPVTPGQFATYRFDVPTTLTSMRLDPSEDSNAVAVIRKVKFQIEGEQSGHILNLADLPKWLVYHCVNAYDSKDGTATIRANAPTMYTMSTVSLQGMRPE
jgi:hypothetical protein